MGKAHREGPKRKNASKCQFPFQGELRLEENRHWEEDNHDVSGDVEHRIGDHVIRFSGTIYCEGFTLVESFLHSGKEWTYNPPEPSSNNHGRDDTRRTTVSP